MEDIVTTTHHPNVEAVNSLHAAALDPTQWPGALRQVAAWIGCACVCVATQELNPERVSHWRWPDDPTLPRHERGWCCVTCDACPIRFEPVVRGSATGVPRSVPPVGASLEIREWSERTGSVARHCFAARARVTDTQQGHLCVRWNQAGASDGARRELFGYLMGHLGAALRAGARVHELRGKVDTLSTVVDNLPIGVVVLNHDARLHYANRSAQVLLAERDGMCLDDGALHAMRPGDDARLRALLGEPASRIRPGAILIPRPSGRASYAIRRIAPEPGRRAPGSEPETMLLIGDPAVAPLLARETLRSLYGLTPSEARLACRLVAGETVTQAAAAFGVTVGTERIHLEHLLEKTGTHRQSELIRFLLESPAAFSATPSR